MCSLNARVTLIAGLLVLLPGCVNITLQPQPINPLVKSVLHGEDCVPIILGLGAGTATIETAMARGFHPKVEPVRTAKNIPAPRPEAVPIRSIHRVQITDVAFFGFGARCVEVVGEP